MDTFNQEFSEMMIDDNDELKKEKDLSSMMDIVVDTIEIVASWMSTLNSNIEVMKSKGILNFKKVEVCKKSS